MVQNGFQRLFVWLQAHAVLMFILVGAFILRAWALPFGLPNLTRPDEQNISQAAILHIMNSFFQGQPSLNPEFFNYPSLYIYLITIIYSVYYLIGHVTGLFLDGQDFISQYLDDWTTFFTLSRSLTVLFGVLTVAAIYHLGQSLCKNISVDTQKKNISDGKPDSRLLTRLPGYLAAGLMATTYLHVRDSHFGVTDIAATFWVTVSLWLSVLAYRQRSQKILYCSCIAAGLAASTKYPASIVAISPMLAFWFLQQEVGTKLRHLFDRPSVMLEALKVLGLIFGAFLLTSPFILLDHVSFLRDFVNQSEAQSSLILKDLGTGLIRHLSFSLWHGLGPLYLIAGLTGATWAAYKGEKVHWLLLGFAVVFYVLIGNTKIVFVRYILPLTPVFCVYTTWLIVEATWFLKSRIQQIPEILTACILLALIGYSSLTHSLGFNALLAREDTRSQAREWLIHHLKPGEAVGIGLALSHVDLPARFAKYFLSPPEHRGTSNQPREFMEVEKAIVSDAPNQRHEHYITTYNDVDALKKYNIRYVTVARSPISIVSTPEFELKKLAKNPQLALVQHFSPYQPNAKNTPSELDYDPIDAFYVPFTHFEGLEQPGPEIWIYRVN